jgi:hypothetical protein
MNEILVEAGIKTVLTGIRIMERWVQSCRHELLDRCLLWNECHLRHVLREYECSTTGTEPVKLSLKPPRCVPSRTRSRIQSESPT